ncbi:nucleotidyl transferase AbiEii/AbiGii toxin family protein [Ammonifex thiophilus]|uniref:nucleotidyl transferase AbiEii/AbiGii toxin family protein n=1 Tax=Ammonifex thiophilus TaxID=444093 RepID=UPI0014033F5E|nr:nucleotidyl transferase AbiEii/AbiGii toxin family protein [Ammonifex thiophilus]
MGGPDAAGGSSRSRPPTKEDLKEICRRFRELGVRYVLVGGLAVNFHGRPRMTHDIDFLVDPSPENIQKLKQALLVLPDKAAEDLRPDDLEKYGVVRVVDEVVVDLIARIGDVEIDNAGTVVFDLEGEPVVVADLDTLIKTKQGLREQDKGDLFFLLSKKRKELR